MIIKGVFGADLLVSDLKIFSDFDSKYKELITRTRKKCSLSILNKC